MSPYHSDCVHRDETTFFPGSYGKHWQYCNKIKASSNVFSGNIFWVLATLTLDLYRCRVLHCFKSLLITRFFQNVSFFMNHL